LDEGGEILFKHLFGKDIFYSLNYIDLYHILNISNWNIDFNEFRETYKSVEDIDLKAEELVINNFNFPSKDISCKKSHSHIKLLTRKQGIVGFRICLKL
jgi:hypothetical protein